MIVLGIDPGARWTALVVRDTRKPDNSPDAVLDHELVDRDTLTDDTLNRWAWHCTATADELAGKHLGATCAVEEAVAPSGFGRGDTRGRIIDPTPIVETAFVAGALCERLSALLVPPAGFGAEVPNRRVLEAAYPPQLIGTRETTGAGHSRWQHLRAAFDVAKAGATLARAVG